MWFFLTVLYMLKRGGDYFFTFGNLYPLSKHCRQQTIITTNEIKQLYHRQKHSEAHISFWSVSTR